MNKFVDIGTYAFVVAGILVLTRPGSQGPTFVRAIGGAFSNVVQASSGQKVSK